MKYKLLITVLSFLFFHSHVSAQGEGLIMPFMYENNRYTWVPGENEESRAMRINEYVRSGQSAENKDETILIITLNKAFVLPNLDEQLPIIQDFLTETCPGLELEVIQNLPDGVLFEGQAANCSEEDETENDGHIMGRILRGNSIVSSRVTAPRAC